MYNNLKNNLGFLTYRQESADKILAVFFLMKREKLWKTSMNIFLKY